MQTHLLYHFDVQHAHWYSKLPFAICQFQFFLSLRPFVSSTVSARSHFASAGANQLYAQFSMDQRRHYHGPKTDTGKQIFCNRPLNVKNIVAMGFDMDFTLAQYIHETFESLAYEEAVEKLVYDLNYPSVVVQLIS